MFRAKILLADHKIRVYKMELRLYTLFSLVLGIPMLRSKNAFGRIDLDR